MEKGSEGLVSLGIPERLAGVLWWTVQDFERTLVGKEDKPWARLTGVALSRCVLHFASLHRELGRGDVHPELTCSEVFRRYAEQLMEDNTIHDWGVPEYLRPVVSGAIAACGQLVAERMSRD
jgi:hypothetical protein